MRTPKNIEKYGKHYSETGLFAKIRKVCRKAGMRSVYYVLLLYYVLADEKTSWKHKGIIIGALGYFILPFDLTPDFIPIAGFTDDLAAITACIKAVYDNITPAIKTKASDKLNEWFTETERSKVEEFDSEI